MLSRECKESGITLITVTRRDEVHKMLKQEDEIVLNSESPDFTEEITEMAREHNAKACFEAVGGVLTGKILKAMPDDSVMYIYGLLSQSDLKNIPADEFIFRNKRIEGFWLINWM